jgi:dolichyl-phosphate beta-glucosyltransferase
MTPSGIDLSIIVPAYNEAKRIPRTLKRLDQFLGSRDSSYEILVVLDGSTDDTLEVLNKLSGKISHLRVIDRPVNRGKGYTVKEGMLKAFGKIRLFTDADNSTDIAHLDLINPLFERGCDLVIASRHPKDAHGAQQAVSQEWYKQIFGKVGNLIVRLLAVPGIRDTQCGFKAFRCEAAERIFSRTTIDGWGIDIEVLALARAMNYNTGIIPARWINDPRSNVRSFDYVRVLGEVAKVWFNLRTGKYNL